MNASLLFNVPGRACVILRNVYLGLWVLFSECRWLAGEGLTRQNHLNALHTQREALRGELARLTVLADSRRVDVEGDLTLIEEDCLRLEGEFQQRQAVRLAAVRGRFSAMFAEPGKDC